VKTVEQAIKKGKRYLEFLQQQIASGKFNPSINKKAWHDDFKARDKKKIAKSILRLQ